MKNQPKTMSLAITAITALMLLALPLGADEGNGDDAYTMWGIFHHDFDCDSEEPNGCSNESICIGYLTGQRVQSNGRASFAASYEEGSTIGTHGGLCNGGLVDAENDIVAVIIRTHGSYTGADEQITKGEFLTCPFPTCNDLQYACWIPGADTEGETDVHSWTGALCDPTAPIVGRASLERGVANEFGGPDVAGIRVAVHTKLP